MIDMAGQAREDIHHLHLQAHTDPPTQHHHLHRKTMATMTTDEDLLHDMISTANRSLINATIRAHRRRKDSISSSNSSSKVDMEDNSNLLRETAAITTVVSLLLHHLLATAMVHLLKATTIDLRFQITSDLPRLHLHHLGMGTIEMLYGRCSSKSTEIAKDSSRSLNYSVPLSMEITRLSTNIRSR